MRLEPINRRAKRASHLFARWAAEGRLPRPIRRAVFAWHAWWRARGLRRAARRLPNYPAWSPIDARLVAVHMAAATPSRRQTRSSRASAAGGWWRSAAAQRAAR
jgi:hypothetical protein